LGFKLAHSLCHAIEVKHLFNGGQSGIEIIDVCSHVWLHSA